MKSSHWMIRNAKGEWVTFPDVVQRLARQRARGICECTSSSCPHYAHCRLPAKEFHHKKSLLIGGNDELSNCHLLCKACHERVHASTQDSGRL